MVILIFHSYVSLPEGISQIIFASTKGWWWKIYKKIGQCKTQSVDGEKYFVQRGLWWSLILVVTGRWLLQCEAPKVATLVYNSNNYGLWYL